MSRAGSLSPRLRYRARLAAYHAKQLVPGWARPALIRLGDLADAPRRWIWRRRHGGPPIPPASLRRRVGSRSLKVHSEVGRRGASAIERILAEAGHELGEGDRVLDWGCGSGRLALHLRERGEIEVHGCDPDREAIAWLRRTVPDGERRFQVSGFGPPLPYEDASFDVVYGVSVVTHLSEHDQRIWLEELARVLTPDGVAVLSTAGPHAFANPNWAGMPRPTAEKLGAQLGRLEERGGFIFISHGDDLVQNPDKWSGISGDYGVTYQTEAWTRENWGEHVEVEAVIPRGLGHQDAVVAVPRRRAG